MTEPTEHDNNAWSSRAKLAFGAFAVIAAFFLVAEHRAHVLPYLTYLPFLLLAACPLMHVFMHGGHGGHGGDNGPGDRNPADAGSGEPGAKPGGSRTRDGAPKDAGQHQHGGRS